jgi:hypothetical protein
MVSDDVTSAVTVDVGCLKKTWKKLIVVLVDYQQVDDLLINAFERSFVLELNTVQVCVNLMSIHIIWLAMFAMACFFLA